MQLRHQDKDVAQYLSSKVKLRECLTDRAIEDLQAEGIGPKTLEALRALRDASANLPKPQPKAPPPKPSPIPPPSAEEQARILDEVRENSLNYLKNLPDYICTQVTRRYFDPTGLEFWRADDTITARLTYFERKEDYKIILVNNQVVNNMSMEALGGASSTGEFGSLLRSIFERKSRTEFAWDHWATLRGKRMYVFSYQVPLAYSDYHITYERTMTVGAGHHGLIYVDKETNMVTRIKMQADSIPPSFPVQQASTQLDFDYIKIGDRDFLLPLRAEMRLRHDKFLSKNELEFRMYRKFAADATITFDTPAPLPEEKIKEEPPK